MPFETEELMESIVCARASGRFWVCGVRACVWVFQQPKKILRNQIPYVRLLRIRRTSDGQRMGQGRDGFRFERASKASRRIYLYR